MAEIRIRTLKDGPYEVRGPVTLVDAQNAPFQLKEDPIYLCRCGQSANKPFCDGTHKKIGFRSEETAR
jgi:CDGSH-type Zn-finger protein